MALPEFSTISGGNNQNMDPKRVQGVDNRAARLHDDEDSPDEEGYEIVKTREMLRPSGATTSELDEAALAAHNEKMEKKRQKRKKMKKRAKTAVTRTGKAVTSSYACGACVAISGLVTMICGIIMLSIGTNEKQLKADAAGKTFLLAGGSIFFLFGLTMCVIAIVYTAVHYIRKRNKEKNDPFKLKQAEKERAAREKAIEEGKVVAVETQERPLGIILGSAPEHEHEVVTEHRVKEARRNSLFTTGVGDVTPKSGRQLKKSQSAFELLSRKQDVTPGKLPPLQSEDTVAPFGSGGANPLPPIKSASAFDLESMNHTPRSKTNMSRNFNQGGFGKSKSTSNFGDTSDVFSMRGMGEDGLGPLPAISAIEKKRGRNKRSNSLTPQLETPIQEVDDITEFDSDI